MHRPVSIALVLFALLDFAAAQSLVRNIRGPGIDPDSNPSNAVTCGNLTYFAATTRTSGNEPWVTDGTTTGTYQLADINPGTGDSNPRLITQAGNMVFFVAGDVANGSDLYATDGTPAGTHKITINPSGSSVPQSLTAHNGILYFAANDGVHGRELWRSDGTANGTWLVMDIRPGAQDSGITAMKSCHGSLFFSASDGVHFAEPWISDGTPGGTQMLLDINLGDGSYPASFVEVGAFTVFTADDGYTGIELWRTDGTAAGTQEILDIAPGPLNSVNTPLYVANGLAWFVGSATGTGPNGVDLYRTDGTAAGTMPASPGVGGGQPIGIITGGPLLYFVTVTPSNIHMFWRSDGTPAGTFPLQTFVGIGGPTALLGNTLFYNLSARGGALDIWATDGTVNGTRMVLAAPLLFVNIPGGVFSTDVLCANGNQVLLVRWEFTHGRELWRTDGIHTDLVANINTPLEDASSPATFTAGGKALLFAATTTAEGRELWRTDGTTASTSLVADCCRGPDSSNPRLLTSAGNLVYFVAQYGPNYGDSLWRSDGSAPGTYMVADPGVGSSEQFIGLTALGDRLLFSMFDFWHGKEPWVTDGTVDGTRLLMDINPGLADSAVTSFTVIGGIAYFAATDFNCGRELWRTDGTTAGTWRVADLQTGNAGSNPDHLTAVGSVLYFTADDGLHATELWRSDGTAAGTVLFDLVPGIVASAPDQLTAAGNLLYFTATDPVRGRELWRSDGTAAGTYCVVDLAPGTQNSTIASLTAAGDRVYFTRTNGTATQLWVSDGTAVGTMLIDPVGSSTPTNLTHVGAGRHILFSATSSGHGREVWISNGTQAGTVMLNEINPGTGDANPSDFARVGDLIVFAAEEPTFLRELYAVSLPGLGVPLADSFGTGCGGTGGVTPRLQVDQAGTLGNPLQLRIARALPQTLAWFCFADARNGSPGGCNPMINPFVADAAVTTAAGEATWSLLIPNSPAFLGNQLFSQGVALDPMGYLNVVSLTQGLRIVIGN